MTEVQIPWVEGAKYFKVLCRLGINKPDIVDDDDRYPNLTPQGGTVEITSAVSKFRYMEPDGRSRMVYTVKASYNIQPSTGELEDVDGNVGVFLMDTSSPGIDPPNFTYTATVRPAVGEAFPVTIPGSPGSEVVDLVAHAPVSPSTGDSTIESRVAMLEQQASSGSGVDAEVVQDIVGSMVAGAGGTYDDVDGTITLPSDAVSSVAGRTGDVVLSSADLTDAASLATYDELSSGLASKAPKLGSDDNYVTDAEKTKLANLSGTNTGDQDLSGYITTSAAPELIRDTMGTALVAGENVTITPDDAGDSITIAAAGGGADLAPVAKSFPGLYTNGLTGGGPVVSVAWVSNQLAAHLVQIARDVTVDRLGVHVLTANTDCTLELGLYTIGVDGRPGDLIAASGALDASSTGGKEAVISASLPAGTYWAVVQTGGPSSQGVVTRTANKWDFFALGRAGLSDAEVRICLNAGRTAAPLPPSLVGESWGFSANIPHGLHFRVAN